jgi:hypothetical protein
MRSLLLALCALAACKVADKQPLGDGGVDGSGGSDGMPGVPDTSIDDGPGEFSNSGQASFAFSANMAGATFQCRVDNEVPKPCTSPYVRALPDGTHTFSVRAVLASGVGDDTPAERTWTIDTVAPTTTITKAPPAADNTVMPVFMFTSNETSVTFDCSLDNAGFVACQPGQTFGPIGDGPHSFAVRARDRAGNVDASPAIYAWNVDTRTPDTQILSGPPADTASATATFTFISPDAGGGATFQCSVDGGGMTPCTSPFTLANMVEGAHTFAVRVRDAVGNFDPTPATWAWRVDLTAPVTTITSGPSGTVAAATASFMFTASETPVTFACSLDGAPATACTSPFTVTGLAQGAHSFAVAATDAAGHTDATPATRNWSVDTIAPTVMITAGPAEGSTSGPRVSFAFTASDGTVTCSFDNAAFTPCASPVAVNLPAGAHVFAVRAVDGANNMMTATRNWTVMCSAPDANGAAGLLHLDTGNQDQPNAVAGGADATLGDTIAAEPADPSPVAGRFAGGLAFNALENDHLAWPTMLAAMPELTVELWAKPDAAAGARDVVVTGDNKFAIRAAAASPTTVRFSATVGNKTINSAPVAAGAWHHVLASYDGAALRLWVDGVRTEVAANMMAALDSMQIGGNYSGALDEIWVAQSAISDDESALQRYCPM